MTIRDDTDALVDFLNSLVRIDPAAMGRLVSARVPCNQAMADHPTVQVSADPDGFKVGFLGIINGYAGSYDDGRWRGWGPICAVLESDGTVTRFRREAIKLVGDPSEFFDDGSFTLEQAAAEIVAEAASNNELTE